jgi:hypothetical protein
MQIGKYVERQADRQTDRQTERLKKKRTESDRDRRETGEIQTLW